MSGARSSETGARQLVEGWIFDVYPSHGGMIVWITEEHDRPHRLRYRYAPTLYAAGSRSALEAARQALARLRVPVTLEPAVRRELMSGEQIPVIAVAVHNPLAFPAAARLLARVTGLTLYNCDILTARLFFYETGLFPLARCAIACAGDEAKEIALVPGPEDLEYALPPLTVLRLHLESPGAHSNDHDDLPTANPSHGRPGRLEAGVDGETVVLDGDDPVETIRSLNRLLQRYDPDVLLTEWGDPVLLPRLQVLAERTGIPLQLNRDPVNRVRTRRSRSYTTYGQVVFQAGAEMLHGRWHIDLRNSFIYAESELAGLLEVARLARIPVQELARTSTGTAISSMQLQRAVRDGILIPWQKSEPEAFKTASQLIVTDKGGLTYQPLVGLHEQVGELDFSSMYPTMMAKFNISPETIGCACCPDSRVPEINYTVCRQRRGLVPQVLDHLLERRMYYKRRKQATTGSQRALYEQRQTALKWCLVTCLDGETLVPFKKDGRIQVAPIREVIDPLLPDGPGVFPAQGLYVFGYDENLRPIENPVKNVIKVPAPFKLLRVRMQSGRELTMIPKHRCFVVEDGRLLTKRASELCEGDLIPVTPSLTLQRKPVRVINVIEQLRQELPVEEHPLWRVFGSALKDQIAAAYRSIRVAARGDYTDMSIWNWRGDGYLPLQYLAHLPFRDEVLASLSGGRGKREGGIIKQIPALLTMDQDLGFLIGFFIGDGSARRTFLRFSVSQNEPDVAWKLRKILAQKFHLRSSRYKERKARMYVVQVNSIALARLFEVVLGVGKNAQNGKIDVPPLVWNGKDDVVYGFLSGLIASDGCVGKKGTFLRISSAYRSFIGKLGVLLATRGIAHCYRRHGHLHSIEVVDSSVLTLRDSGWLSQKHRRRLEKRLRLAPPKERPSSWFAQSYGPFRCVRIRSIEEVPSTLPCTYCFEVERGLHGFTLANGIFTANSFGYLGFRNARFGRIEAHEAVTASP